MWDWLIRNKNDDSFWNNDINGWTDYTHGTIFSQEERDNFKLPIEGEWETL